MTEDSRHRLPRTVVPHHYDLRLEPDLEAGRFAGRVEISVEVTEATEVISLNAVDLDLGTCSVTPAGGDPHGVTAEADTETERVHLHLDRALPTGTATVAIGFSGPLTDALKGFYRSRFTDPDGVERTIATTQFEPTDARRALPCWDEPDRKATFSVTLVVAEGLTALSNEVEVDRSSTGDGRVAVRFAETMAMSTYLLAFIVGPLELTEPVEVGGVPLRVAHPPGKADLTGFALEVGAFALAHYADYFASDYPAGKLDLVAIPDFAFGAMENLGCVTFRETALLVDPERATQGELQRVADVITHEIAHMWFGDLVTMSWWNGIWLNEAFATFMEMRCVDAFRPAWDRWTDFGVARSAAFDTDALESTRPVEFEVVSPTDAEGMFDILTYEKGAAVVRMLEQYLGEDRFRAGIRRYMATHRHANTDTGDLWDAIEAATGEPVRRIMDSWIFQGGHPRVGAVTEGATVTLDQTRQRFLAADPEAAGGADVGADGGGQPPRWSIPVLVRTWSADGGSAEAETSSSTLSRVLLEEPETRLETAAAPGRVLVNAGGSGFYRVRYAPTDRAALAAGLGDLSPIERYNLLDDTWASVLAGTDDVVAFWELLGAYATESHRSVWQRITGSLGEIDRLVPATARESYAARVRGLVNPALARLGERVDDEAPTTTSLRATLFATAGTVGDDPEVLARSRALVAAAADDDRHPERRAVEDDPDRFDAAVRVVAAHGDQSTLADYLARSAAAPTPQDELRYLGALARIGDEAAFDAFCAHTLSDEVRSQDAPYLLRSAITNRGLGPRAWRFTRDHWTEIEARFPSNSIPRLLSGVRTITDRGVAADVEGFMAEHPVPQGPRTVAQHLERMRVTVALAGRAAGPLGSALG